MQLSPQAAEHALRPGKVVLLAEPAPDGAVVYRYDDTNPEGRTARMLADRADAARGRPRRPGCASDQMMREPGSRYIDFLIPGLHRHEPHGQRDLGPGLRDRRCAPQEADEAHYRHAHAAALLLAVFPVLAAVLLVVEVGVPWVSARWFSAFRCADPRSPSSRCRTGLARVQRISGC